MHELSLCQTLLRIVEEQAAALPCSRITKINLEFGVLAAIDRSAFEFAFEAASQGTIAAQATLHFIEIAGQGFCESCQKSMQLLRVYDPCDTCAQSGLQITQGNELRIQSMEVI